jgi:GNAT superfamily N-acetyltransferase
MFSMRPGLPEDGHHLLDIDLKCYDTPWTPEMWRRAATRCVITIGCWNKTPMAMAIYTRHPDGDVELVKLAVKPAFRRLGLSRVLFRDVLTYAAMSEAPAIKMLLHEDQLEDVCEWAAKLGFKARKYISPDAIYFEYRCSG